MLINQSKDFTWHLYLTKKSFVIFNRECKQPSCPIFKWITTKWERENRVVYCAFQGGSSKVRLGAGCDQDKKPSDTQSCKSCHEHAVCDDGNCVCKPSFSGLWLFLSV